MPVPVLDLDVVEGNHVLLKCNDFELLLAHCRPGSVRVRTGDYVVVGQTLRPVRAYAYLPRYVETVKIY